MQKSELIVYDDLMKNLNLFSLIGKRFMAAKVFIGHWNLITNFNLFIWYCMTWTDVYKKMVYYWETTRVSKNMRQTLMFYQIHILSENITFSGIECCILFEVLLRHFTKLVLEKYSVILLWTCWRKLTWSVKKSSYMWLHSPYSIACQIYFQTALTKIFRDFLCRIHKLAYSVDWQNKF